jgi:hypothetical protein
VVEEEEGEKEKKEEESEREKLIEWMEARRSCLDGTDERAVSS